MLERLWTPAFFRKHCLKHFVCHFSCESNDILIVNGQEIIMVNVFSIFQTVYTVKNGVGWHIETVLYSNYGASCSAIVY